MMEESVAGLPIQKMSLHPCLIQPLFPTQVQESLGTKVILQLLVVKVLLMNGQRGGMERVSKEINQPILEQRHKGWIRSGFYHGPACL